MYFTETISVIDQKIERDDAVDVGIRWAARVPPSMREDRLDGVERAGADVAEDDAERSDGKAARARSTARAHVSVRA